MKKVFVLKAAGILLPLIAVLNISLLELHAQTAAGTWEIVSDKGTGHSLAQAGDVNGDGYNDMVIGNPYYSNGQANEGRVMVFYGSSAGFAATPDWVIESNQERAYFGWSVAGMNDMNNDNYADVIIGAPGTDNIQGKVFIYYGSANGLNTTPAKTLIETQTNEQFGYALATADMNNDGYSELFVGAPYYNGGDTESGRVYSYLGSSSGLPSSASWSVKGTGQKSGFGWTMAIGAVTSTGSNRKPNLIIGAPGTDTSVAACVTIMDALPTEPNQPPAKKFTITDSTTGSKFGYSIAIAGDINHDGYEDIAIGAPYYTNGQLREGRVTVYHGGSTISNRIWTVEGNEAGANFGTCVAGKGRINNDTLDDIAVTAPGSTAGSVNIYTGTNSSLSSTRYSLSDLTEPFSSLAFFRETGSVKSGMMVGISAITSGTNSGKAEVKFIREFEDILTRKGIAGSYSSDGKNSSTASISVYPNPAVQKLTFDITAVTANNISIEIINTLGLAVYSMNNVQVSTQAGLQSVTIDLPTVPQGMYYAAVHIDGQTIFKPVQINQ